MQKKIKRKICIYGVIAVVLAVALAITVSGGLFPMIEEIIFRTSESADQTSDYSPPETPGEAVPVNIDVLYSSPSSYQGQRVIVSGKVSKLGLVKGPLFLLEEKIWGCYLYEGVSIDISNLHNGDHVTVTGLFRAPDTIYAESIEKT